MSHLVQQILPLSLGAAFSPTVLAIALVILSGPHGRLRMAAFTVTNVGTLAAIGVVWVFLFKHSTGTGGDAAKQAAAAAVDTTLGVVLIIFGLRALLREPKQKQKEDTSAADPQLARYAVLGVLLMVSNLTTLALYLPASKDIAIADVGDFARVALLTGLTVIASVTAWGPLLLSVTAPATADRVLGAIDRFTTIHAKAISVSICFGFGLYLIVKGVTG